MSTYIISPSTAWQNHSAPAKQQHRKAKIKKLIKKTKKQKKNIKTTMYLMNIRRSQPAVTLVLHEQIEQRN